LIDYSAENERKDMTRESGMEGILTITNRLNRYRAGLKPTGCSGKNNTQRASMLFFIISKIRKLEMLYTSEPIILAVLN
jgi:hypothetical protein